MNILQRCVRGVSRAAGAVSTAANVAGTLVVLVLVAVVNYDVIARGVFNHPFRGAYEVVQFSMVLIVFLQLPDVVRAGRLTRSDGLAVMLRRRHPRAAMWLQKAIDTLSATVMTLIAIAIYPEFTDMWETNDFFGVPGVFTAPWWPIKLTILCSAALCAVIFALSVLRRRSPEDTR